MGITEEGLGIKELINEREAVTHMKDKRHGEIIYLKRGGLIVKTKEGYLQFGIPPETVKDSLNLGIEVPEHYIIPSVRFDKKNGINVAEFEFPAYFNYFLRKKKINLICTKEAFDAIRVVFQETLLGPTDFNVI
jgi:hypothetical protein